MIGLTELRRIVYSVALATDSNLTIDGEELEDSEDSEPFEIELVNDLTQESSEEVQAESQLAETIMYQLVVTNLLLALILGCICSAIFSRFIRG